VPKQFGLQQNYPNPFNPRTGISYQLSAISDVTLRVYDVLGREIAGLVNDTQQAGTHVARWDAATVPSGVYFYRMEARPIANHGERVGFSETRKMLLIK
jgi:hypothetical protein